MFFGTILTKASCAVSKAVLNLDVAAGNLINRVSFDDESETPTPAPTSVDTSFLTNGGDGTFDGLNNKAKGIGGSAFNLFTTLGIIAFVIAIMVAAITLGLRKNPNKRDESKSWIFTLILAIVLFFSAITLIGYGAAIGNSI